jgi:hypothetical protein
MQNLPLPTSSSKIICLVKHTFTKENPAQKIGIDGWALHKGYSYGASPIN